MIILGIDPGTTTVGYGVIKILGNTRHVLDYGVIETTPKIPLEDKLVEIGADLQELLKKYDIDRVGIEKLFFNTNITTGIAVSHARGVIMYECSKKDIPIFEYTPLEVKKAVCGNGRAEKAQVQRAMLLLLSLGEIPKPDDAADALGIAYMTSLEK